MSTTQELFVRLRRHLIMMDVVNNISEVLYHADEVTLKRCENSVKGIVKRAKTWENDDTSKTYQDDTASAGSIKGRRENAIR